MAVKLIVGLGNPEKRYLTTRHNAGMIFCDALNNLLNSKNEFSFKKNLRSEISEVIFNKTTKTVKNELTKRLFDLFDNKLIIAKPQLYRIIQEDRFL